MNRGIRWATLATLLVAVPALAQDTGPSLFQRIVAAGGLPTATRESRSLGVPESDLQACAEAAMEDGSIVYNAVTVNGPDEVLGVLRAAWRGPV